MKEEIVSINLTKPKNLLLEELIVPNIPFFVPIRKEDGSISYDITEGKNVIKHIPTLYYFIHILLERQHSKNEAYRYVYDEKYVKMYSRDIEPLKSKNDFKYIWAVLLRLKVIEFKSNTEPNKYKQTAKGYYFKLTDIFEQSIIVEHSIYVKKSIAEKLSKRYNGKGFYTLDSFDTSKIIDVKQLYHQYQTIQRINFDSTGAKQHLLKLLSVEQIEINKYNSCIISINNLVNGRIRTTKSEICNRFYTPITNMPKVIRPFIKDGEDNSLEELDFGSFNAFAVYKLLNSLSPVYKSNAEKIAFENELDLYRNLLSGGDFYMDFKEVFFSNEDLSRDEIKNIVLRNWFNGKPDSRNKYRQHILKRLPRISNVIDSLKMPIYENFSSTAMKMESELINDIIYKKFIELHPDVIMFTIFDSFLVEHKYSSRLLIMMQDEGNKYFNLNCHVRTKSYKE